MGIIQIGCILIYDHFFVMIFYLALMTSTGRVRWTSRDGWTLGVAWWICAGPIIKLIAVENETKHENSEEEEGVSEECREKAKAHQLTVGKSTETWWRGREDEQYGCYRALDQTPSASHHLASFNKNPIFGHLKSSNFQVFFFFIEIQLDFKHEKSHFYDCKLLDFDGWFLLRINHRIGSIQALVIEWKWFKG